MECPWDKFCENNKHYAPLVLRLVVGIAFAVHGWQKLVVYTPAGFSGAIAGWGIPAGFALFLAWVVTLVELVGGVALVLGFAVRYFGALQAFIMLVAIFKVHIKNGLTGPGGYELALLFLAGTLSLCLSGAGPLSLDHLIGKKKHLEMNESVSSSEQKKKTKRSKK